MVERATLHGGTDRERLFDSPRTVRLGLAAGDAIPPHSHPGTTIVLSVAQGHLAVYLGDDTHHVAADELLRFDGDRDISLEALEDSVALLVLAQADAGGAES